MRFVLKVESLHEGQGVLADETGKMNYSLEEGVTVNVGRTYEVTGQLCIQNFRLTVKVVSVSDAATAITNVGAQKLSAILLDNHSSKPIIQVHQLPENRIGQSVFAVLRKIERSEGKVKAILADNTAQIEAEITPNKKGITTEVLDALNERSVYLCSDVVLQFNEQNNLVARFNFRSKVTESTEAEIKSIGVENLSLKHYNNESEKNAIIETIRLKPRVPKSERPARVAPLKKQKKATKVRKNRIPPTEPVTISNLLPWNRNQSVYGKILSLNVVNSVEPRNFTFLKGQIGDSTGVVDYDLAQKKKSPAFEVGQVVLFEKVINQGKEGRHFVEVKRFGNYTIVEDHPIDNVNASNNLSEKDLPEQPPKPERAPREFKEPKQPRAQKQSEPRHPAEQRAPREPLKPSEPIKINELQQGNNKQSIIGKVLHVKEETRLNKDKVEQVHLVGAVADETGAIDFDILKQGESTFKNNDVVQLNLVMNKQVEERHFVQIIQLGSYTVLTDRKIGAVITESVIPIPRAPKEKKPASKRSTSLPNNNNRSNVQKQSSNNSANNESRNNNRERGTSNNNNNNNNNNGQQRGGRGNSKPRTNNSNNNQANNNQNNGNNNNNNNNNNNRQNNHTNYNQNQQVAGRGNGSNNRRNNGNNNVINGNSNNFQNQQRGNSGKFNNNNNNNNINNNNNSNNRQNNPRGNNNTNNNFSKSVDSQALEQLEIKKIKDLFPGQIGDNIIGVVFEVNEVHKTINGKPVVSQKGRIADETANITFDLTLRKYTEPIKVGQTYLFKNLMNKVDDDSFHFITVGKLGSYSLTSTRVHNPNKRNDDNNLSTIAYEKKQVQTPQ